VRQATLDQVRTWLPELALAYRDSGCGSPSVGIETKRGCPYNCSYCVYPALQGGRTRFRSPKAVVAEAEMLRREAGIEWVQFTDPVLNDPPGHFREVCRRLIERGVPVRWTGFFRENMLTRADARLAAQAGCAVFLFTAAGTCDVTLARLHKGITQADILHAAACAAETDALSDYLFMANVPGTDEQIVRRAEELIDRLHDVHESRANMAALAFQNLRVYPHTRLARELVRDGALDPNEDLTYPTYYNPAPFHTLRFSLEQRHLVHDSGRRPAIDAAASER
jgi:radical SAM superfamily enzyme YgiQ (UPF0313 family)